ncbi:MAG: hypothetical protein LBS25_00730, partial [Candidatus Symbiothrix sp.]|nr:hypothetical protein [Candidatus Symbiothrix sp.]
MRPLLLLCFLTASASLLAQSRLISPTPQDGKGKQIAGVYAFNGQTKADEGAFNLLYNASEGSSSTKKWCNNSRVYPWVVFELTDIYAIDKIVFRDVKPYESNFGNVPEYWVYVSTESAENCSWTEVAHLSGQSAVNVKEVT